MRTDYFVRSIGVLILGFLIFSSGFIAFLPVFIFILAGILTFIWSLFAREICINCKNLIPNNAKKCPSCGISYNKKKDLLRAFNPKNYSGNFWFVLILCLAGLWIFLIATLERTYLPIVFGIGALVIFLMSFPFIVGFLIGSGGGTGGGGKESKKDTYGEERYYIKYKDGKTHLFKEGFPFAEDKGVLHEKFDGNQETINVFGEDYEVRPRNLFRQYHELVKKNENEQGILKEPDPLQSIAGDKSLTYERKEQQSQNYGQVKAFQPNNYDNKTYNAGIVEYYGHGLDQFTHIRDYIDNAFLDLSRYKKKLLGLMFGVLVAILLLLFIYYTPLKINYDVFAFANIFILMLGFFVFSFIFHGFTYVKKLNYKIIGLSLNLIMGALFGYLIGFCVGYAVLWFTISFAIIAAIPIIGTISIFFVVFWLGMALWSTYKGIVIPILSGLATINPVNANTDWLGLPLFIIPLFAFLGFFFTPSLKHVEKQD